MAITKKASTRTRRVSGATKKATKKVAKKTPRRTTRKVAAKKTAKNKPVKKAATKKPAKKKVAKKVAPPQKKLKPVKKDTLLKKGGPLSFPQTISLSLFTPLVPINPDQIAIGVARITGAAFVLAGLFFAATNTFKLGSLMASLNLGERCSNAGCTYTYAQGQPASAFDAVGGFSAAFSRPMQVPASMVMHIDIIVLALIVVVCGLLLIWLGVTHKKPETATLATSS